MLNCKLLTDMLTHEGILWDMIALPKIEMQQKAKTSEKHYPVAGFPSPQPPDKIQNAQEQLSGTELMPGLPWALCAAGAKTTELPITAHLHPPAPPFPGPWVPLSTGWLLCL